MAGKIGTSPPMACITYVRSTLQVLARGVACCVEYRMESSLRSRTTWVEISYGVQ